MISGRRSQSRLENESLWRARWNIHEYRQFPAREFYHSRVCDTLMPWECHIVQWFFGGDFGMGSTALGANQSVAVRAAPADPQTTRATHAAATRSPTSKAKSS